MEWKDEDDINEDGDDDGDDDVDGDGDDEIEKVWRVACCVYWADPSPEYWSTTKDEARRPNFHKKQKGDDDHLNNKVIGTVSF